MNKVSVELNKFLEKNQSLKSLPQSEILSIMTEKGLISREEAADFIKNSAFEKGFSNKIDVIPDWKTEKSQTSYQNQTLDFLKNSTQTAEEKLTSQNKTEGTISRAVNFVKETFNTENRKSNVENIIESNKNDIKKLTELSSNPIEFKAKFKELRGVDFSAQNIELCNEKADEMNRVESIKSTVENLKNNLDLSTVNNASNAGLKDANNSILKTFTALGIKNKNEINKILKDIEKSNADNETIKKYGGDFRISKNKKGDYIIYRTDKSGFPSEATMEELQIIADEMKLRLNKAYSSALGLDTAENATNEELEKLTQEKYNSIKSEYNTAYKKAYGKKNADLLADNYIKSQKENTAYIETSINLISMATMVMGSGVVLKGASLLTKTGTGLKAVTTATNIASKATPAIIGVQTTQPVKLIENLTAEEPDWKSYGMSVAEGAMWMALGFATGAVGDKARMFLGQKGLQSVAKNTGKSVDELIKLYRSGHKLPKNLGQSLSLIENASKLSGTTAEFTADVLATYAIQKSRNEDVTFMDYLSSANGALMGTVMNKSFSKISDAEKVKVIQKSLLESNPHMSKTELENASETLLDIHKLAEIKRTSSKVSEEFINQKGKTDLRLTEAGEKNARAAAELIHKEAATNEKYIVKLMENAGFGVDKTNMIHRPKSAQSLYDKIKNAICDVKKPATMEQSISSIKDAVGTRTELADFDYKKHPDIVEMYKKDPQKAVQMAIERQSEEMVNKVKEVIKQQAQDPNSPIKATRITNYIGKDGIPYFSERQVAILRDYAAEYGIDLNVKTELTKVRPSGYTALQMNFETKTGLIYEWQLRGSKINKFAECEHVPYDIKTDKDVTGGNPILKELYAPINKIVAGLSNEEYINYNKYITAHYEHLRKQELGFESKAPKPEDFGINEPKLKAENLELLHELAEGLKKGKIDEQTALNTYLTKTEKKIVIPQGKLRAPNEKFAETDEAFGNIIKNRKEDFIALSKIKDNDEFIKKGAELIFDEMGLTGAPIKIEITDNINEFSMDDATLRISRNWAGLEKGHQPSKGDKAEILGAIAHELNHYLQNKEIYLNTMLREEDFKYNLNMSDKCKELLLWGLGLDENVNNKFPYPLEQPDNYFNKANDYLENFMNYIEPYKMEEINGKMEYAKNAEGHFIIDEKSYEKYLKQLVEAESLKRGDIVRDEYKKLINGQ